MKIALVFCRICLICLLSILNLDLIIFSLLILIGMKSWNLFLLASIIAIIEQMVCYWLLDWEKGKEKGQKFLEYFRVSDLFSYTGQWPIIICGFLPARILGLILCRLLDLKKGLAWLAFGTVLRVAVMVLIYQQIISYSH